MISSKNIRILCNFSILFFVHQASFDGGGDIEPFPRNFGFFCLCADFPRADFPQESSLPKRSSSTAAQGSETQCHTGKANSPSASKTSGAK
jgi:hypothetical protein